MKLVLQINEPWDFAVKNGSGYFDVKLITEFFENKWNLIVKTYEPNAPKYMILSQRHNVRDGHWNIHAVTNKAQSYIKTKELSPYFTENDGCDFVEGIGTLYEKSSVRFPNLKDLSFGKLDEERANFKFKSQVKVTDLQIMLRYKLVVDNRIAYLGTSFDSPYTLCFMEKKGGKFEMYQTNNEKSEIEEIYNNHYSSVISKKQLVGIGVLTRSRIYTKPY